jgi:hypothetical protein
LNDYRFKESLRNLYDYIQRLSEVKTITVDDSPYDLERQSFYTRIDASSGAVTVNLPPSDDWIGDWLVFKKVDSSANVVTLDAAGSDLIDGAATTTLSTQYDFIQLYCPKDGFWDIIGT